MKEDDGRGRRAAPLEAGLAPSPATDMPTFFEAVGGFLLFAFVVLPVFVVVGALSAKLCIWLLFALRILS